MQNYLHYKGGRKVADEMSWDDFYEILKQKEKEHGVDLIVSTETFKIQKDKTLPKPFKKKEIVDVEIKEVGRRLNERIGVAQGRCVTVYNCKKDRGKVRVRIIRDKHNIFSAVLK